MEKIEVLIADDHTVVRQGLKALLEAEPDITVVGEAETGRQALQLTLQLNPKVVVMDIAMPVLNGIEAMRQIAQEAPATRVVMLSSYSDDEYVCQVAEAGAVGYLLKETAALDLVRAIREAQQGNAFFSPLISKRLLEACREKFAKGATARTRSERLTSRESEVLQLVAEGKSNRQISAELRISVKTVEKHRQELMDKLDIHDVAGLTRFAISKGVIQSSLSPRL